jgi:hypothetical protein
MNTIAMTNRHPVDELAENREQQKALKQREEALREVVSTMMGSADSLGGSEWIAKQDIVPRKGSLDERALKAAGLDPEKFRKPGSTAFVIRTVRRAVEDAE